MNTYLNYCNTDQDEPITDDEENVSCNADESQVKTLWKVFRMS